MDALIVTQGSEYQCTVGKVEQELAKFKLCSYHKVLKKLLQGQKDVPGVAKIYVL